MAIYMRFSSFFTQYRHHLMLDNNFIVERSRIKRKKVYYFNIFGRSNPDLCSKFDLEPISEPTFPFILTDELENRTPIEDDSRTGRRIEWSEKIGSEDDETGAGCEASTSITSRRIRYSRD